MAPSEQQPAAHGAAPLSQPQPAADKIACPTGPYLSVVVTARNDDHGVNLLGRMQAFVNAWMGQCRRHQLPAELIIVEWNPPADRPTLADALEWPDGGGFCEVRIIEVPAEIHQGFRHWQAMPLYQMIGKNVGIRRARGEFVLATNIDILFSSELVRFFAERRLERGKMYRVNRWDVMAEVPVNAPVEEQLAYCQSHLIRLNAREGTFRMGTDGIRLLEPNDIASQTGPVKLGAGWFQREMSGEEPFRWVDNDAELIVSPAKHARILVLDVEPGPGVSMSPFLLELRDASQKHLSEVRIKRRSIVTFALPKSEEEAIHVCLHTPDGGNRIRSDLRTLNFRVFRCAIRVASSGISSPAPVAETVAASASAAESWRSRMGRGLRVVREIWRGNPDVQIRLPLSQERMDKLQLTQDGGGISFSARALKRPSRRAAAPDDILPPGMRAVWGAGWYPLEHFGGETFRWMQRQSVVVWLPPRQSPQEFVLHVDTGPAVGFKPCEVEIRDQWGEIMDVQEVSGRSAIRIPVDYVSGPFITAFEVRGGGPPKRVSGDTRELALRVVGCTWEGEEHHQGDSTAPEVLVAGAGIWSGRGWSAFKTRQGSKGLAALSDAELILRAPDGPNRWLTLEVAPRPGTGSLDLLIEDTRGRVLFRGNISGPRQVRLKNVFLGGNFYALRLRDAAHEDDLTPPAEPMLFIPAIQWDSSGDENQIGGDCVRIVLHQSPPDQAVHLHTNACGDFTLLAREHWMDLRAYPELDLFSMNIDSVFCWMAHHGGAREEMLEDPMRIYHIEHGTGSGWTPEGERKLFERIAAKGLSWLDYHEVIEWARIMNRYDAPMIFNREEWGLAKAQLKESAPR